MNMYGKFKNLLDPAQQEEYVNVIRKLDAAAKKKGLKVVYSLCDEGTNDGVEARSGLAVRPICSMGSGLKPSLSAGDSGRRR